MTSRALSFGAAAATYERYRPGYPDELVEQVLAHAGRPVRTALEIGAGTGKATRAFAAHGVAVDATEPDQAMLAELRRHVPDTVTAVLSSFEALPLTTSYDAVLAAASLHWTDPATRWERIGALLRPGGVVACFGAQLGLADPDLEEATLTARAPYLTDDEIVWPARGPHDVPLAWPGNEMARSALLSDVRERVIARRWRIAAEDYTGYLATVSAYLVLPDVVRRRVLERVRAALPAQVDVISDLTLHVARRASG